MEFKGLFYHLAPGAKLVNNWIGTQNSDFFAERGYSLPIRYYCYKLIQLFRVTCFIAGQYFAGSKCYLKNFNFNADVKINFQQN